MRRKFNVHKGGKDGLGQHDPISVLGFSPLRSTDIKHERVVERLGLMFGPRQKYEGRRLRAARARRRQS